jgi:hypothetical protein
MKEKSKFMTYIYMYIYIYIMLPSKLTRPKKYRECRKKAETFLPFMCCKIRFHIIR